MISPELRKLMYDLENGVRNIEINAEAMLEELHKLDEVEGILEESLSLSSNIAPGARPPVLNCKRKMNKK